MRAEDEPSASATPWRRTADWAGARRADAQARIETARERHATVRVVLTAADQDRITGGPLLAGALAFRLFLWLLPAGLVVVACLGFFSPGASQRAASGVGLGFTSTIATATAQAHQGRWVLLATGLFALFQASVSLARTLWVATALAWQLPVVKLRRPPRAAGLAAGILLSALGLVLVANWLRSVDYALGLATSLLLVVVYTVLGWAVLWMLPRPPHVSAKGLLPGAFVIGIGVQVLHLLSVLFLAQKLSSASQLYGTLGTAATVMLWTYLLARILIAGSTVNRAWAAHHAAPGTVPTPAPTSRPHKRATAGSPRRRWRSGHHPRHPHRPSSPRS